MNPITVVGLGPAGAELIVPAARSAFARIDTRFVRTARHPAVEELARYGIEFSSFDAMYDTAPDLETVYGRIVDALIDAAAHHAEVVYAVPGSPVVAERTVALLRERQVPTTIIPGLSFADLAWARLGLDPLTGARVVDGRAFAIEAAGVNGALLIAQCDTRLLLGAVKLALLDALAPDHAVVVLQRLGMSDERVRTIALEDLDRVVDADHLTSLFVDTGDVAMSGEFAQLLALTQRLRGPGGCPWDAKQTHHSLARHTLEEAYEVVDAIELLPIEAPSGSAEIAPGAYEALEEELGDLLFQVMIHSVLAAEAGAFTVADVARGVHAKLVHRHPHVFGDVSVDGADEVVRNWEQLKKAEKQHDSLVDGIPVTLPALLATPKLYRKMRAVGLDPARADPVGWLRDAVARFVGENPSRPVVVDDLALGELLAACVAVAGARDLDPEAALRAFAEQLKTDFRALEAALSTKEIDIESADLATIRSMWDTIRG